MQLSVSDEQPDRSHRSRPVLVGEKRVRSVGKSFAFWPFSQKKRQEAKQGKAMQKSLIYSTVQYAVPAATTNNNSNNNEGFLLETFDPN